ncbi:MAG: LPS export ABC transporter periplasmic protein LptC [Burkholderiales bacterium]|nr:LPS export ABC transporter periplasmic protein LptC [Burkholderiales bacterium]
MSSRARGLLPLLLLLLLAGLTFWLSQAVTGLPDKGNGTKRHDPDMFVDNFTAKQFGADGTVRYTLAARKMVHYPDDDTSHLTDVKFNATETGAPPFTATSDTGVLTQKGEEIFLRGNVILVREAAPPNSRIIVRTSYLHVIPDAGIAQTDQPVELRDASKIINAASMRVNNKIETITLTRVRASYAKAK